MLSLDPAALTAAGHDLVRRGLDVGDHLALPSADTGRTSAATARGLEALVDDARHLAEQLDDLGRGLGAFVEGAVALDLRVGGVYDLMLRGLVA